MVVAVLLVLVIFAGLSRHLSDMVFGSSDSRVSDAVDRSASRSTPAARAGARCDGRDRVRGRSVRNVAGAGRRRLGGGGMTTVYDVTAATLADEVVEEVARRIPHRPACRSRGRRLLAGRLRTGSRRRRPVRAGAPHREGPTHDPEPGCGRLRRRSVRAGDPRPVRHQPRPATPCRHDSCGTTTGPTAGTRCDATPDPEPTFEPDIGSFPFLEVEVQGVYEIPVGPVHAGLIEPGHFRFSVVGETILRMKARLWFVHRGIEKLLRGAAARRRHRARRAGQRRHRGRAHARVRHGRRGRLSALRSPTPTGCCERLLLELERMHNHVADLGALAQRRRLRHHQRARACGSANRCCG